MNKKSNKSLTPTLIQSISLEEHNRIIKEIISQYIEALVCGRYIDVDGVKTVCYYEKEHKNEVDKWRKLLKRFEDELEVNK